MKRTLALAGCLLLCAALAAHADTFSDQTGLITTALAAEAAQATLEDCKSKGFDVAVTVVDAWGQNIVLLRHQLARPHTVVGSQMKAYTIVTLGPLMGQTGTSGLSTALLGNVNSSQVANIPGILLIQGGVLIKNAQGVIYGGIGVAGSKQAQPGQLGNDEQCANVGVAKISGKLP